MAFEDPIVAEVRDVRERLQADAGGFDEYVRKLKTLESGDAERLVTKLHRHDEMQKAARCAENSTEYNVKR
jgi:hypothetical protein